MKKRYVVILYSSGPAWEKDKTIYEQNLREHAVYMEGLLEAATLVMGGPFSDSTGGLVIVEVADAAEANGIVERDPAVRDGILNAQVRPWHVVFERTSR